MRRLVPLLPILLLTACDPNRDIRPIQVIAPPDLVQRQACQALMNAENEGQDEVILNGVAEHGRPDTLRVSCEGKERRLVFILTPPPDDLGMKALRKQWQKRTSKKSKQCPTCPKYNVRAKFVGALRADPAEKTRLLYFVRTADKVHRIRIQYGSKAKGAAEAAPIETSHR